MIPTPHRVFQRLLGKNYLKWVVWAFVLAATFDLAYWLVH